MGLAGMRVGELPHVSFQNLYIHPTSTHLSPTSLLLPGAGYSHLHHDYDSFLTWLCFSSWSPTDSLQNLLSNLFIMYRPFLSLSCLKLSKGLLINALAIKSKFLTIAPKAPYNLASSSNGSLLTHWGHTGLSTAV